MPTAVDVRTLLFGQELDALRRERGFSWDELAARSNVSATYLKDLSYFRRGQNWPSPEIVAAIAAALDYPPERFLLTRARRVLADPAAIDYAYNALLAGEL
jgi:transcriptional regulator with XRE-family HTH domain